jgi:hypothetical protein
MKENHHVIPRSRTREFGLNQKDPNNQVEVDSHLHNLYHQLFANKAPWEIIDYLSKTFWGGKYNSHMPRQAKIIGGPMC